jgi:membrane-bound transcription factor site-1 protease
MENRLAYAAVVLPVLLLTLRILPLPSGSPSGGGGRGEGGTPAPPASRYVVRFVEYRLAEEHREYLGAGLRGAAAAAAPVASWRWVERRNPAAAFPTDFAVLEIRDAHRDAVVAAVRALGRVRDVHADATYSRSVLSAADRPPPRRGKLFTAMSFEGGEEGGEITNSSSATWGRRLLVQVRSLQDCFFGLSMCHIVALKV